MRIHFKRQLFQVKSLKQLCARKKCFLCTLFSGAMSLISLFYLVHWNIICLNLDIEMHLKLLCQEYRQGKAFGDLCEPLCETGQISILSCQSMHKGKVAVFTAQWNDTVIVIKSHRAKSDYIPIYWINNSSQVFPNYEELVEMISQSLKMNFGVHHNDNVITSLFPFLGNKNSKDMSQDLMINLWQLSQDNEYVMLMTNQHSRMFPKILSTCGTFYAVEYAEPVFSKLKTYSVQQRILYSKLILQLLHKLSSFSDPIHICDVKLEHFGVIDDNMVVLDADTVLPKSVVERSTSDGRSCRYHQDCDLFDCRSLCNQITNRCDQSVVNNNLQLICEKLFLNAGLLSAYHLPASQRVLIENCAFKRQAAPFYYHHQLMSYFEEYLQIDH